MVTAVKIWLFRVLGFLGVRSILYNHTKIILDAKL